MAVIAVGNTKGGSGKTTTAIALATAFAGSGLSVALLDGDPDGRAGEWFAVWAPATGYETIVTTDPKTEVILHPHTHNGITLVPNMDEDAILDTVEQYNESHDLVIIDLQGSANQSMLLAFGHADLVIIPVQSSRFDLKGMVKTVKTVRSAARSTRREIPHWVLLTRTSTTINQTRVDRYTRQQVIDLGLNIFTVELGQRTALQKMTHDGLPPNPANKGEEGAAENIQVLMRETAAILQGKHPSMLAAVPSSAE